MIKIILISLFLVACSSNPVVVKLPLPVEPELPMILGAELQCLSASVYDRLRKRDIIRQGYTDKLKGIIKATW